MGRNKIPNLCFQYVIMKTPNGFFYKIWFSLGGNDLMNRLTLCKRSFTLNFPCHLTVGFRRRFHLWNHKWTRGAECLRYVWNKHPLSLEFTYIPLSWSRSLQSCLVYHRTTSTLRIGFQYYQGYICQFLFFIIPWG